MLFSFHGESFSSSTQQGHSFWLRRITVSNRMRRYTYYESPGTAGKYCTTSTGSDSSNWMQGRIKRNRITRGIFPVSPTPWSVFFVYPLGFYGVFFCFCFLIYLDTITSTPSNNTAYGIQSTTQESTIIIIYKKGRCNGFKVNLFFSISVQRKKSFLFW